jgi:protein-tyrosine phosphatase
MRQVSPYCLWLGHVGDVRNLRTVLAADIAALVDLAINEPHATITRELVYCRFPLLDGEGNAPWLLRAAIETTAGLLRTQSPTLVYCASGMSRSPAIAAAAIAILSNRSLDECLAEVVQGGPRDLSPALWRDVCAAVGTR